MMFGKKRFILLCLTLLTAQCIQPKADESEELISFSLKDEPLFDIVNRLAAYKSINIIFPEKQDGLQAKVNFPYDKKVSPSQAWNFMETFLRMAGFSIIPQGQDFAIVALDKVEKEPLPLWGNGFSPDCLPDTDESIRYLYSFANVNLSDGGPAVQNLQAIFNDMLAGNQTAKAIFDKQSNSVLLSGSSRSIKGVMNIVYELDHTGFRESVEVVTLRHTDSKVVIQILNKLIPDSDKTPVFAMPQQRVKRVSYFAKSTRVVDIPSSNSIAVMGKIESVDRVIKFIKKYLDQPPESHKNVLHVKHLSNLNAETFAVELKNIIKNKVQGSQSTGKDDLLSDVIIVAQKVVQSQSDQTKLKETEIGKQIGGSLDLSQENISGSSGNNLIIAAKENDWRMIERIIDQLDRPQLQVAFEVLIVEVTLTDKKILEAQVRGSEDTCDPPNTVKWQSPQITQPVLNYEKNSDGTYTTNLNNENGLDADLLPVPNASDPTVLNIAELASAGTSILSYKSTNGILGIVEALNSYNRATILSQPFLVTSNHEQASIDSVVQRLAQGSADTASTGGPVTLNQQKLNAALSVALRPRISISNNINLQIVVKADEFVGGTDSSTRNVRTISTNANVHNKETLVLGGLTKVTTNDGTRGTPVLSSIPLVGNLFKRRNSDYERSVLLIFISPSIIYPLLSGGTNTFTDQKKKVLNDDIIEAGENFENLTDPISRIVFPYANNMSKGFTENIDQFISQSDYKKGGEAQFAKSAKEDTILKDVAKKEKEFSLQEKILLADERKADEKNGDGNQLQSKLSKSENPFKKKSKKKKKRSSN